MNHKSLQRRQFLQAALPCVGLAALAGAGNVRGADASKPDVTGIFNVRDFGANGDGVAFDTVAIQAAIDACEKIGGGKVVLQGGIFLSRTIYLKSNVTLYIEAGAVLRGTANLEDYAEIHPAYVTYTYSYRSFIYAENTENISILGKGAIDLSGSNFPAQQKHHAGGMEWGQSPFGLLLVQCRNLTLRDITVRNCPMAAIRIVAGENVLVEGVVIDNRVRISCDGIEIVSSREVCVSNCHVYSWDDGICIKSSSPDVCRNITITNCTIRSLCNAIKFGTESTGGFENITVSNCTIEGGVESSGEHAGWRSINGLALMIVDGGVMNQVNVSNLVMRGVRTAIFLHIGNRARLYSPDQPTPGIGILKNVSISNIIAEVVDGDYCCSIIGEPGHPIENVVLDNIQIRHPGGGTRELAARSVMELPKDYPESIMYGPLPAYGFYCRHAKGITLRKIKFQLTVADFRPAIVCEDVENFELSGLHAANSGNEPLVRLRQVRHALFQNCQPQAENFLAIEGEQSADVALLANDLRSVRNAVTKADKFTGEVSEVGNLRGKNLWKNL